MRDQGSLRFGELLGRVLAVPGLQHPKATPGATSQAGVWGWTHPRFPPEAINQRGLAWSSAGTPWQALQFALNLAGLWM